MSSKDIQVIDVDEITRVVRFTLKPKTVNKVWKLIQLVVMSLMNNPGQDVLDPDLGGGLPSMIGMNINPNDSTEVFAEVAQRIKKTESEIISQQIGSTDPAEEKLRELQIVDIKNGNTPDEIFVRIRIINQLGQSFDIMV